MRNICLLLIALCLLCSCAVADPLVQTEDLSGTVCWPEGSDPDTAVYVYTYAYPQVAGDGEAEQTINETYAYEVDYDLEFDVPTRGESIMDTSTQSVTEVRYEITANDDEYFSVLIISDSLIEGERHVSVQAQVFARSTAKAGHIMTMPYLLGILADDEDDDWLRNRQTNRADEVVRELVWADIEWRASQGEVFPDWWTEEMLADSFFPEEEFYYDGETGCVVFFFQPYMNADGMAPDEYYTFTFDFEDILDEM